MQTVTFNFGNGDKRLYEDLVAKMTAKGWLCNTPEFKPGDVVFSRQKGTL